MTDMHATAEPAYLDRLALHSNPFSRQNLPGAFFAGRQISQRLNLILHLLRSSSQIGLIAAPDGYGKSMLLTTLQQRGGEDLRFCLVRAGNTANLTQITQQCLQAFGATGDNQLGGDQQQLLRQRLQQLQQIQVTPVLLLDDAEQFDSSVLQQLAGWLHWQHDDQYLLRAVVTTNKPSAVQSLRNERFQELDLLPLAEDEINGYLQQRMQAAGWQDDLPFTDKQLQRIQRHSGGIPLEINHQAHQSLLGVNKSWHLPNLPSWRLPPAWHRWLPLLPVAAALLLLLLFQQNINDWLNQGRDTQDEVTELAAPAELPMVIVEDDDITSNSDAEKQNLIALLDELESEKASADTEMADEVAAEIADKNESAPAEPLSMAVESTNSEQLVETATPEVPAFTPVDEMTASASSTEEVLSVTTPTPSPSSDIQQIPDNEIKGSDWIMQQPKSAYTFQLMGSWERAEIVDFIDKHALAGDVAIFASMRDKQVWYALIYGVYDTKSAALKANKQWPEPLNGVSTWLRRFDGVQTQIIEKGADG